MYHANVSFLAVLVAADPHLSRLKACVLLIATATLNPTYSTNTLVLYRQEALTRNCKARSPAHPETAT